MTHTIKQKGQLTLDEAIEHAEQKATDINCSCQQEHAQLAVWLKELRTRRELDEQPIVGHVED